MQTGYQVLFPEAKVLFGAVDWPFRPEDREVETMVRPYLGGHPSDRVQVVYDGTERDLFVVVALNSRIGQPSALAFNSGATSIYRNSWLRQHPGTDPETLPAILGPAVLFERPVWRL
jgi:hypothetical protein